MPSSDQSSFIKGYSVRNERANRDKDALLISMQSRILSSLSDLLTRLFNKMDDAFFDMAQHATNNNEQSQYFDAMRELRLHARDVDNHLRKELAYQFALLHKRQKDSQLNKRVDLDLTLVDKERVEVDVALANIRNKIKTQYPDLLLHISQRLNRYLEVDWLDESNIPLGTQTLVNAFSNAIDKFDMPLKIRLMVFKYFERFLVDHLRTILVDTNKMLADVGADPQVKTPRARPHHRSHANASSSASGQDSLIKSSDDRINKQGNLTEASSGTHTFEQVSALLSQRFSKSLNHRLFKVKANQLGPELKMPDLMTVLAKLQEAQASSLQDEDTAHIGDDYQDMILLLEHQLAIKVRERGVRKLSQADDNVISLVSMIFEFVLDDHNIPPEISLLLGRLQIPIIKIALADRGFLNENNHPARRLLKKLSQAAIGWEKESVLQRDLLMEEIRNVVSRVLNEYEVGNMELFTSLEKSFSKFMEDEERRARDAENQIVQIAQNQSRQEMIRSMVNQLIVDRLQGKILHADVIEIIDGPWREAMQNTLLRYGRDSEQWKSTLSTLDELIWSIQPQHATAERPRWIKLVPELLKQTCTVLESVSHPKAEIDQFLATLWDIHSQLMQSSAATPLSNSRTIDNTASEPGNGLSGQSANPLRHKIKSAQRKALLNPESDEITEIRHALLNLPPGQWVEVYTLDGKIRRCKLAYHDPGSDRFIFVSRRGNKVLETNIDSLIQMAESEDLLLLEEVSMWDRAISQVVGHLNAEEPVSENDPA
ncbi:MAG: DUF1631 domain-containing protein [Ketobacter sp.]|nr:MAG: DUF1631 domain-containing protein [Ketobacter sp.]